jgi:hypothetical protein
MEFKGQKGELAKELHNYFREKICSGDYEVTDKSEHIWTIVIDDCFKFVLWVCNSDYGFRTYEHSFMEISFTQADKTKGWNKIEKQIKLHKDTVLKDIRKKKYEELKSEFENQ